MYSDAGKKLILELLNESYMSNRIAEAIEIGSVEALRTAIKDAVDAKIYSQNALSFT